MNAEKTDQEIENQNYDSEFFSAFICVDLRPRE